MYIGSINHNMRSTKITSTSSISTLQFTYYDRIKGIRNDAVFLHATKNLWQG